MMADLLIAAAEECKCNNREKLMENDSTAKDFTDTHHDINRSHQGVCVCACACVCVCVCVCILHRYATYTTTIVILVIT